MFGFAPYWALGKRGFWNFSLLSTVAYFGLDFQSNGSINTNPTNPGFKGWMSQDLVGVINSAHAAGSRVVVVVKAFDNGTINAIVSNPAATQNAINWTIQSIRSRNLDGVNIDFEGSSSSSYPNLATQFSAFVSNLSSQVHAAIPGSVVSVDTYSGSASWDGGFMNISQLAPSVDSLFVMAYDMGFSNIPGHAAPNAPLNGWTYNDTTAVSQYLSKAPASKVILGAPYYGYKYSTTGNGPYATATGSAQADPYESIVDDLNCAQQLNRSWDATAASPWASWWSPAVNDPCGGNHNSWRELYYDDASSLMAKYDLVNRSNLQGTGMWALGYDGSRPELWQAIQAKMRASWAATFDTASLPWNWAVNQTRTVRIGITNVGNSAWPAGGAHPVRLSMHFMTGPTGAWLTDQRFTLPSDVGSGQTVTLDIPVTAPPTSSAAVLQATMVKEDELWFKQWGTLLVSVQGATWMASYDAGAIPRTWTHGQTQTFAVVVTNTGNQVWPAGGSSPVRLGLHFAGDAHQPSTSWLTDQRFSLPNDLSPGQSVSLTATITAPATPSGTVLEAQLVREGRFWFYVTAPVAVTAATPAWTAAYDLSRAPRQWIAGQSQVVPVTITNTGNQAWPASTGNPVRLGIHFAPASGLGSGSWLSDQRFALTADLQPGQTVTLNPTVTAPASGISVVLEAQLVKEQQFWFNQAAASSVSSNGSSWLAGYVASGMPRAWIAGQPQTFTLTVTNTGNQLWPAAGAGRVRLGLHFAGGSGLPYARWLTDDRVALPSDLNPGQSATLSVTLNAPATGAAVVLEAEMVKEGQFWFVQRGAVSTTYALPSWMAVADLSQAPRTWTAGQTQSFPVTLLNAGNQSWPSVGANPVQLGLHFATDAGLPYARWLTDERVSLPAELAPGQSVALNVTLTAPSGDPGGVLEAQAVKEWQFWFAERAPVSFLGS